MFSCSVFYFLHPSALTITTLSNIGSIFSLHCCYRDSKYLHRKTICTCSLARHYYQAPPWTNLKGCVAARMPQVKSTNISFGRKGQKNRTTELIHTRFSPAAPLVSVFVLCSSSGFSFCTFVLCTFVLVKQVNQCLPQIEQVRVTH